MLTKIGLLLLLLQTHPMPPAASGTQQNENLDAKLQMKVNSYQLEVNNFVEALARVASDFQIPMGIQWVNAPAAKARLTFSWKDSTVRGILEAIVKTQPGYKIVVRTGVVHISSSDLVPDHENPLNLRIKEFEVHNVPAELASRQLHEIVRRTIVPPQPQQGLRGGVAGSGFANIDDPKISVTLKDATVEDVLDALALASARKIWIVTFSGARALTAAGYRRTPGLWTNSPVPDDEQPVWDMLHWGDAVPVASLRNK
ncbi:MAG TPA: hypothetical protein VE398_07280 [Acidobacteriota bacterium]|nr:hypothetical protein [Acidobacteriota bacterium]